jgi:hypothetical protein
MNDVLGHAIAMRMDLWPELVGQLSEEALIYFFELLLRQRHSSRLVINFPQDDHEISEGE